MVWDEIPSRIRQVNVELISRVLQLGQNGYRLVNCGAHAIPAMVPISLFDAI